MVLLLGLDAILSDVLIHQTLNAILSDVPMGRWGKHVLPLVAQHLLSLNPGEEIIAICLVGILFQKNADLEVVGLWQFALEKEDRRGFLMVHPQAMW
ncbi:hypothetical protein [Cyanobium gracile]|uniref:Uncharacterized protein n=1 Tax=Cyanobium gracile (strain ATCC 27147 / PCC 6307) TaxID=292564 RepID=K9P1Y1_CYAGP|nr:hypothetical protein [Cyanobium gracile]AFY27337.1 hypothetical protein Cyagr_0121 [Cyanobium gracile PCC 6307]